MNSDIQKTFAFAVGIVFVLVGILGFIPALVPGGALLGIFAVNVLHSVVHLLIGILGIAAAYTGLARRYNQVIGAIYLLLGVLGFIPPLVIDNALLGIVSINLADNLLHLVAGTAMVAVGFALGKTQISVAK
ncbi:membrane protein [Reticulibacter mediterranei]|uniref:Membrane protein n=1 Tax=Reticulibacter mediterranei TaxID=2778369 RepID=A0A8J3IGY5_9CHLR|nr:DUF4383 domain-containing protein [Reticulibacter mediterranei]GHO93408.1 membrane protein [Reticulibacter mediterranei]